METDGPLNEALEEIRSSLDPEMQGLIDAAQSGESIEDAWQAVVEGVLDEA